MRRLVIPGALAIALGCHPRVDPEIRGPEPAPMCATMRTVREQTDGGTLVVELTETNTCTGASAVTELARAELEVSAGCPAGQLLLEGSRGALPGFAARFDGGLKEVSNALANFTNSARLPHGRAFVVSCTEPSWLLVATGDGTPRAMPFRPQPRAPEPVATPHKSEQEQVQEKSLAPLVTGTCTESLQLGAKVWVGRSLVTGLIPGPSSRTTWTLGLTGTRARLAVQEFKAPKQGPPQNEQPEGTWACVSSTSWEGTARGDPLRLSLSQGDGGQELELSCRRSVVGVADANARRIRVPSMMEGCNASRWSSAARRFVPVLSCVRPEPGATPIIFGERPGVEHVTFDNDDCGRETEALRAVPRDGGIAPLVKLSEQPDAFVPRELRRKP